MERGAASSSHLPIRGHSGFVGLRVTAAVAGFAALAAGLGAAAVFGLEQTREETIASLRAELEARQEAGRSALAALEETRRWSEQMDQELRSAEARAARGEARALAAALMRALEPGAGEGDEVDPARAWATVSPPEGAQVAILDAAGQPTPASFSMTPRDGADLADALSRGGRAGAVLERHDATWAAYPLPGGRVAVARVALRSVPRAPEGLERAASGLVDLAETTDRPPLPESAVPVVLGAGLLAALGAHLWARSRLGAPLAATLARAEAFAHGDQGARADEQRGGRDAREFARAVNTLIERAERLKRQGQSTRDEDVAALVRAIEDLAKGDLSGALPEVGEPLEGVLRALARARSELLDRIRLVQELGVEVASNVATVSPSAQRVRGAAFSQLETLGPLGDAVAHGASEVNSARERLVTAISELSAFAAEERRVSGAFRAALLGTTRRAQDLRRDVARVEALVATAESLEDAVDLLAATVDPKLAETNPPTRARISAAVGEGRAAVESIGRELALLRDELGSLASTLEETASSVPEAPPGVGAGVTGCLHEAASALVRVAENAARGVRTLERSAHEQFEGADAILKASLSTAELAPRLGAVLAAFHVSASFEADLLARVERWREDAKRAAESADGLTEEGRALVRQVVESGEAVRARLARLVSVTETAMDVIRG